MRLVDDVKKVARLLLKADVIDSGGEEIILRRLVESKKAAVAQREETERKKGCYAVRFIGSLATPRANGSGRNVTEEDVIRVIAKRVSLPAQKLDPLDLDLEVVTKTIPKPYALKHLILPLYVRDDMLHVAIADPEGLEPLEGLARVSNKKVKPVMASPSEIEKIITEFFGFKSSVTGAEAETAQKINDVGNLEQLTRIKRTDQIESNDEHIKNAVDYLFNYAFELRASDIHIEPKREDCVVRFRIDGQLNDVYEIPKGVHRPIVSRIKMLARMNIAENRRPQDGRIKVEREEKSTAELRVSSMPTAFGEKVVLRVLQPEMLLQDIESLGFFPEDLIKVEKFLQSPNGVVLVTGPTGSGKTTTLYSALNMLANRETNIITVEDPIETIIDTFNQVAVQPGIGMTFAASLRTILRQDPDIIMIGEIRDAETAENAAQAALTGHLVLSSLHTNDTASSVTRLLDLGLKPYVINAALVGVLAQRLVRMVCPHCVEEKTYSRERLAQFGVKVKKEKVNLSEGRGCEECRFTGYHGRTGVYEVMEVDDTIRQMIQDDKTATAIRKYAISTGMTGLRENAARKVLAGETTLAEMLQMGYQL